MDEPVRSRLRAARRRGLTRPDPVTALPWPQRPPASTSQLKTRTSRRKRQRPASHARETTKINYLPDSTSKRATEFTRWIEVKSPLFYIHLLPNNAGLYRFVLDSAHFDVA